MVIYRAADYASMSRKAANIISAQVIMKPDCVLGLATGSTPIGTYKQLIEWYNKGDLDFSRVTSVNLDEYKGLSGDNDQSYRYFMNHNFFDHINIDKARTFVPDGTDPDSEHACARYNEIIREAGTVFWNGPMGVFEFPSFELGTRCVAEAVAASDATSIIGGGDSVAAIKKFDLADQVTFISTGGGASMRLLEGRELPGVMALMDKEA